MVYFYKLIALIQKKGFNVWRRYKLGEYKALHPGKIVFGDEFYFSKMPAFNFDQSNSKLIFADKVSFRGTSSFNFFENGVIKVGRNTFFNNQCSVNCMESVQIGDDCLFGENVKIYDQNHQFKTPGKLIADQGYKTAPVLVGNNCWLGSNVVILKGVTIGNNCVIGANCLIFKDVPDDSLVVSDMRNTVTKIK